MPLPIFSKAIEFENFENPSSNKSANDWYSLTFTDSLTPVG